MMAAARREGGECQEESGRDACASLQHGSRQASRAKRKTHANMARFALSWMLASRPASEEVVLARDRDWPWRHTDCSIGERLTEASLGIVRGPGKT